MVNERFEPPAASVEPNAALAARDAEQRLILSYAPIARRPALSALMALDRTLGDVMRAARDPMLAQMRYTWWHGALTKLDSGPAPAMPVLLAVAADILPTGVTGSALAAMIEGWEALIEGDPADAATRSAFAQGRGGAMFAAAAKLLGTPDRDVGDAGIGWALADLSRGLADPAAAAAARHDAEIALQSAIGRRWPSSIRALGAMAVQAVMDLRAPADLPLPGATPKRVARLGWHRLTGR